VVLGEHDRPLGSLEQKLEAVDHVRRVALQPLERSRHELFALRNLCRHLGFEISIRLTNVVLEGLDDG
jgi:hypothetical protein